MICDSKLLGIYIHIPFCDGKCNYCDFFSKKADTENLDDYTDSLINSIQYWKDRLSNRIIDTIYFGGGTPSILGTNRIVRIIRCLADSFRIATDCEITLEANPTSANDLNFAQLKSEGVNRVSLGLQSAIDTELKLLGRRHNKEDVINSITNIKNSGINNISLDVMLGIPEQTTASLLRTLEFCCSLDAAHISTYMLTVEPDTVFGRNSSDYTFADDDLQAELFELTSDFLKEKGYKHYEISNFCREGKESRHNMRYWELKDYLGLGPSAHSLIDGKRFYYPRSFDDFHNNSYIDDGIGCTKEEYIMLSLRTAKGLDPKFYLDMFGETLSDSFMKKVKLYQNAGYINNNDNCISLTEKGFLVSNAIIAELI